MSGSHQFPPWDFHGEGESEGHAAGFRPQSSESDFFSEFFGPLSPDLSPRTNTAAEKAAGGDATVATADGHGRDEEVESSGVSKEQKHRASTSGGKRPQEGGGNRCPQPKRKRNRTTEMHNMTERRRRDKIKHKLKALQELIPNSHKLDRASLLDEAIAYVKNLQLQIQIMQGSGICHSPCMSPGAMHCLHMPHFSPCSHMGMGYGMGMPGMTRPLHSPLISIPSPMAANMVPMPGFSTIPTYCPLSPPMPPFVSLPEHLAAGMHAIPSPPILHAGPFSSHRGETSSQDAPLNQKPNVSEPISSTC